MTCGSRPTRHPVGGDPRLVARNDRSLVTDKQCVYEEAVELLSWRFVFENCFISCDDYLEFIDDFADKVLKRHGWGFKHVCELPEVIDQATEQVDEEPDDGVFCCGLNLDIVKHTKRSLNAPAHAVRVNILVWPVLAGVRGEHPIISLSAVVSSVLFNKYKPHSESVLGHIMSISSYTIDFANLSTLHFPELLLGPLVLSPQYLVTKPCALQGFHEPVIIKAPVKQQNLWDNKIPRLINQLHNKLNGIRANTDRQAPKNELVIPVNTTDSKVLETACTSFLWLLRMNPQTLHLTIKSLVGNVKSKSNMPITKQPIHNTQNVTKNRIERLLNLLKICTLETVKDRLTCRAPNTNTGVICKIRMLHSIKKHTQKISDTIRGVPPNNTKYLFKEPFHAFVDTVACHIDLIAG